MGDRVYVPNLARDLTRDIMEEVGMEYTIIGWGPDRVYLEGVDGGEYIIRTWDVTDEYIDWSLFTEKPNQSDYMHQIKSGRYEFNVDEYEKHR